ncbi:MAG TPA: tyrosine-type recombinase/integrase [Micromonosporaceae bacterium]|nr:tyrosine-type recombinase/integrase [Micromonosporaceae bacterium]
MTIEVPTGTELAVRRAPLSEEAEIMAAVAALPSLASADPADPYNVRRLTFTWLKSRKSDHTRREYFNDLGRYLAWCAARRQPLEPALARTADVADYLSDIQATGSSSTAARRLSAVSSWYRTLVANGAVTTNPCAGVDRPSFDRDASATVGLTEAEVRALLDAADDVAAARLADPRPITPGLAARRLSAVRDRALLRLLADLGLRVGEAIKLDMDNLRHNRGYRTIRYEGKGKKIRERPISAHALEAIDEYRVARAASEGVQIDDLSGPLFATSGKNGTPKRMDEPSIFRLIRRLARTGGVPSAARLSPHSLRHAFATNAREAGIALEDVQDAMGHADARTTRRYDRGRHSLLRDPAHKLGEMYASRRDDGPR